MESGKQHRTSQQQLNTLIVVLGLLAGLAMAGSIVLSVWSGDGAAGQGLLGICLAIVGYLGGLLTPTPTPVGADRKA